MRIDLSRNEKEVGQLRGKCAWLADEERIRPTHPHGSLPGADDEDRREGAQQRGLRHAGKPCPWRSVGDGPSLHGVVLRAVDRIPAVHSRVTSFFSEDQMSLKRAE